MKQKLLQLPDTILCFQYLGKRKKNKLKQSEIEAKMIIKMKKMSHTDKRHLLIFMRS